MSYPYHMNLWDQLQHQSVLKRLERERREAVVAYMKPDLRHHTEPTHQGEFEFSDYSMKEQK